MGGEILTNGECALRLTFRTMRLDHSSHRFPAMSKKPRVCVFAHLAQDVDIAVPLALGLQQHGFDPFVFLDEKLILQSPRALRTMEKSDIKVVRHPLKGWGQRLARKLCPKWVYQPTCEAFITIVESNLTPHRRGAEQANEANQRGIPTFTYQHGIDNVGLTYSDLAHPIETIRFHSSRVWTWSPSESLHPAVRQETRDKVYAVGCIKAPYEGHAPDFPQLAQFTSVIGLFENLHWARYTEQYRQDFLTNIEYISKMYPSFAFILKPHHAGKWFTERNPLRDKITFPANVFILDPQDPTWEPFTAPALLKLCSAVITTPSTVVLDAGLERLPVAVVADDQQAMRNYSGIPMLRTTEDWIQFLNNSQQKGVSAEFMRKLGYNSQYSAIERISKDICSHLKTLET